MSVPKKKKPAPEIAGIATNDGITVYIGTECYTVSNGAKQAPLVWAEINKAQPCVARLRKLLDPVVQLEGYGRGKLKINLAARTVELDSDRLPGVLAERVLWAYEAQVPFAQLLRFFDRLRKNPSSNSVKQLYGFLECGGMPITSDGCFLAYKGLQSDYWSKSGNPATKVLQGKSDECGRILNKPGTVIEVQRNNVDDNPEKLCSSGLHAGSFEYASNWATNDGKVVVVKIDPVDAVSVPTDGEKLRACKYKVLTDCTGKLNDVAVRGKANPYAAYNSPYGEDHTPERLFNVVSVRLAP